MEEKILAKIGRRATHHGQSLCQMQLGERRRGRKKQSATFSVIRVV